MTSPDPTEVGITTLPPRLLEAANKPPSAVAKDESVVTKKLSTSARARGSRNSLIGHLGAAYGCRTGVTMRRHTDATRRQRPLSVFKQMGQMFGLAKGVFCASFSYYAARR